MDEGQQGVVIPEDVLVAMQLERIFMPYATQHRKKLYEKDKNNARFVHYTSAEAALGIIGSKRLWMRNTTCMSDYREVHHGLDILRHFFFVETNRRAFCEALDASVPGAAAKGLDLFFDQWGTAGPSGMPLNTYIASISEHDDKEDRHGRLSMWRGFGSGNVARVAIVLKIPWYTGGAQALHVLFSPVAYLKEAEVHASLNSVVENVRTSGDFLRSHDRSHVVEIVFFMLLAGAACLKHEGFHEEREWRAIYNPKLLPSPHMPPSTEVVAGIPQTVYKFPIDETVCDALRGLDISRIFDRLIIGPSPYPWVMYEAFVAALLQAGIKDADQRVFASDLPIRA